MKKTTARLALALALVGAAGAGSLAFAAKPQPSGCPRDILCADVWDPVICSDGQVYSNSCYAYRACATGCQPYGNGGPVPVPL